MNPKQYIESTKKTLQHELTRSAMGYLKSGLELFHQERGRSYSCIEPAIGNLTIAVELMLKTFLVKKNPLLIFKEAPVELTALFACPDAIPPEDFNWRYYDFVIRSHKNKTIGLNELIPTFYVFFPANKQSLKPHFDFLSGCRGASVHYSLPSFQKYELERTAYLTISVFKILDEAKTFVSVGHSLTDKDTQFLSSFNEERIRRVGEKIQNARMKSSKLGPGSVLIGMDTIWEAYVAECPVCHSDGVLWGYTEMMADTDDEGQPHPFLTFLANHFHCDECGLRLDDSEELRLAGMDIAYDRSDSDLDKWLKEEMENDENGLQDH